MPLRRIKQIISNPQTRITGPGELMMPIRFLGEREIPDFAAEWLNGISNQSDQVDVEITPLNLVAEFALHQGQPLAEVQAGLLPTGLVIDGATGIITGTPTVVGNVVGISANMFNDSGAAGNRVFEWDITA